MKSTSDKTAVVVGGSADYGLAAASALTARGVHVVMVDETSGPGGEVDDGLVDFVGSSLEDVPAVRRAIDATGARFGGIDILVNSAVEHGPDGFWDVSESQWQRCIRVNMKLPFFALQACVPHMRAAGGGRVVNYSSVLGGLTDGRHQLVLGFAKAGVNSMTRQWAVDLCLENIQANSIWIGYDDSGRLPSPADVGAFAAFLALDATPFLNGTQIPVDAGTSLLRQGSLLG
ncbi:SDR family NAD(P)-dependent oxidoreductase [Propionicicella superfundia]|uniref:SDR family NAD(P)-dependent oxidoreductase n=1 Tax=Propionicicella superfundia TaxID=348582 RepID=UPI0003F73F46|nr:SDR family oxidoreductase [Propionicicella superfundia]